MFLSWLLIFHYVHRILVYIFVLFLFSIRPRWLEFSNCTVYTQKRPGARATIAVWLSITDTVILMLRKVGFHRLMQGLRLNSCAVLSMFVLMNMWPSLIFPFFTTIISFFVFGFFSCVLAWLPQVSLNVVCTWRSPNWILLLVSSSCCTNFLILRLSEISHFTVQFPKIHCMSQY